MILHLRNLEKNGASCTSSTLNPRTHSTRPGHHSDGYQCTDNLSTDTRTRNDGIYHASSAPDRWSAGDVVRLDQEETHVANFCWVKGLDTTSCRRRHRPLEEGVIYQAKSSQKTPTRSQLIMAPLPTSRMMIPRDLCRGC